MPDPKVRFESALGIESDDRKDAEIEALILAPPLRVWLRNASFADFYDQARSLGQHFGCRVPNIYEAQSA